MSPDPALGALRFLRSHPFPSLGVFWYTELFAHELALRTDDMVLDAGTGTAHVATLLSRRVRMLVAADISSPQVQLLQRCQADNPRVRFLCRDVADPAFAEEFRDTFDKAYSASVLEHVADPRAFIKSVCTVLKVGGKAIIHFPNFSWHGRVQFPDMADLVALFQGLPVSLILYEAVHTPYGRFVTSTYEVARRLYRHAKRQRTQPMPENTFHQTVFYKSLGSSTLIRPLLSHCLDLAAVSTRLLPAFTLRPASGVILDRVMHAQVVKNHRPVT